MSNTIHIKNKSEITLEEGWIDKPSFKSKGKTVKHNGHEYTIEAKKCLKYAPWERFGRVLLGLLSVLFSLGISLAYKHVRQHFYKEDKYSKVFAVLKIAKPLPPAPGEALPGAPQTPKDAVPPQEKKPASPLLIQKDPNPNPAQPLSSTASSTPLPELISGNNPTLDKKDQKALEAQFALKFYSEVEQMTFWDSYLKTFTKAMEDEKWNQIPAMLFLHDELQGVKGSLVQLSKEVEESINEYAEKKLSILNSENDKVNDEPTYKALDELKISIANLTAETNRSLDKIKIKIEEKLNQPMPAQTHAPVQGIGNAGSTCYINSALQPLLAVRNFTKLIPEKVPAEPAYSFAERQSILDAFKLFIKAWEEQMPAPALGQRIAELRKRIFEAGLQEGGFVNRHSERKYQDAGQFFELLLHVINGGFELMLTRTPVMDDGKELTSRKTVERTPQGVFYLKAPHGTVQEMVDGHQMDHIQHFSPGNEWRVNDPVTYEPLYLADYIEQHKISGKAPEILVVRVNNHTVDPSVDKTVNFAALFDKSSSKDSYAYELVGFAQNHSQVHWTSVVWDGEHWQHCNDSKVATVDPKNSSFKHPANYMVYKKI